jgi:predicted RNase H-like HicB family nuclease
MNTYDLTDRIMAAETPKDVEEILKEALEQIITDYLKKIAANHKDPILGTYDYDGIAEELLVRSNA